MTLFSHLRNSRQKYLIQAGKGVDKIVEIKEILIKRI
jgi:hypothetical protein